MLIGQVGTPVLAQVAVPMPNGFDRQAGVPLANFATELWVDNGAGGRILSALPVTMLELVPNVGEYAARFTPDAAGNYYLIIRHADTLSDWSEEVQVYVTSLDDIADQLGQLNVAVAADVILTVEGIEDVTEDIQYTAIAQFRRKSTMAAFDPDQNADGDYVVVEVLDSDGQTLLDTFNGAEVVRIGLGRFRFQPTPADAGTNYLRLTFLLPGNPVELQDVFKVTVRVAAADVIAPPANENPVISPQRVYTYPTSLTEAGYDLAALSAKKIWRMCRDVSALIDTLTEQWFNPEKGTWHFDGRGSAFVYHRNEVPIIAVEGVTVLVERTNDRDRPFPSRVIPLSGVGATQPSFIDGQNLVLVPETYVVKRRVIERVHTFFPGGSENIEVEATLGWIENAKDLETTSVGDLGADTTELEVADITGFAERDVVDIFNGVDAVRIILRGVSRATNRIQFDALGPLPATIAAGATVRTLGQTPLQIENLANFLFGKALAEVQAFQAGGEPVDPARIKKETVDDYSYELFDASSSSALLAITGSYQYEAILRMFRRPASPRLI